MEPVKLEGIGCFGKPERVEKLLSKTMQAYSTLYNIPGLWTATHGLVSGTDVLAGFFLGFSNRTLNLSVFTRRYSKGPPIRTPMTLLLRKASLN